MSGVSNILQKLVYDRLVAHAGVAALVGSRIYDAPPPDVVLPFISFGPSDGVPDDADCITGLTEVLQIDCWSVQAGKREIKEIVNAVKSALHGFEVEPDGAALVGLRVVLWRVMDDPDGVTRHGVVQIEAQMEEDDGG